MSFDYLIVGNSILGLTTAYRLNQLAPSAKIGIIGPTQRTSSATAAAGAMLGLFGEVTATRHTNQYDKAYFELAHYAQSVWPDFVAELNDQLSAEQAIRIHPNGTFVLRNTQDTHTDDSLNYQAILRALKEYNEPHETIEPQDIPGLAQEASARALASVYIPNERSINPMSVLHGLERVLHTKPPVTQIDGIVTRLCTAKHHSAIAGVELLNGDRHSADQVIIAAGVGSQDLIDTLPTLQGRIPHIMSGDGVSFVFDQSALGPHKIKHVIRTPNRAGAYGLHLVPNIHDKDVLYLGAGNVMQWRPLPGASMESATWLMNSSLQSMSKHLGNARLLRFNQGNRPTPIDGYPLLGACSSISGLWCLTGTGRDGFQRSPALSEQIAKQLTDSTRCSTSAQTTCTIFDTFAPERLPIQTISQAESIVQLQKAILCAPHEIHSLLPRDLQTPVPEELHRHISSVYAQLNTDLALVSTAMLPLIYRRWSIDTVKAYLDTAQKAWR